MSTRIKFIPLNEDGVGETVMGWGKGMSNPIEGFLELGIFTPCMHGWDLSGLRTTIDPLGIDGVVVTHYAPMPIPYIED